MCYYIISIVLHCVMLYNVFLYYMPYASMPSLYSRTRARHMNALAIASVVCCRIVELGAQCSTPTEFHQSSPRH